MATPILIVDDSAMSRKLMIRSLPKDWDVEISQVCNGKEAIEACRSGKADVMFLDLTMPVMNGYEVLEIIKKEDLNTFVIVVSADIQTKARERVLSLGAMEFIKKPMESSAISETLKKFGIL